MSNLNKLLSNKDIAVLIISESNDMFPQSLMLCESIRSFAGVYSNIKIVAVSPRPQLALDTSSQARLKELDVEYVVEDLNRTGSAYGPINRIVASAWAEQNLSSMFVLALDSDTIFIDEPKFFSADVGVRPVDMKGANSSGSKDPNDTYLKLICEFGGIDPIRMPILITSIDKKKIRASYNGGFSLIRCNKGIFQKAKEIFFKSFEANLRPFAGKISSMVSSTGSVEKSASEFWTSGQIALSVAIHSVTNDVYVYDNKYNIPLNCLSVVDIPWHNESDFKPIMLHYHHLMKPSYSLTDLQRVLEKVNCPMVMQEWIFARRYRFEQ